VTKPVGDLELARACLTNDEGAQRQLEAQLRSVLPGALKGLRRDPAFADEVRQKLLEKLLVGPHPKIAGYSGRGPLKAWLRAAALRTALHLLAQRRPSETLDERIPVADTGADPELAHLRRRFAEPLKRSVEAALKELSRDDRNALRFYFLEGMTVQQIATLRGVHKSNVSRLIARVRRDLLASVTAMVKSQVRVTDSELESVLRLMRSNVDVSIERALS